MRFKKVVAVVAIMACAGFAGLSFGELLGIIPGAPTLIFNNTGTTAYTGSTDLFAVDACPLAIRFAPGGIPRFVNPTGDPPSEVLRVRIVVDEAGMLLSGVPDEDLIVTGEVDQDGDGTMDFAGVLLTGEIAEFGYLDTGTVTDQYDFRFNVTGGLLADAFFTDQDIGVALTSESSTFEGAFTGDFGGEAKGILGPIPLPLQVGGCTPGYWKQPHHFDSWSSQFSPDDLFEVVFDRDVLGPDASPTLGEALRLKRGGENALIRHTTAALLNAAAPQFTTAEAFDTVEEVVAAFQAAFDGGDFETTKALMEDSNEAGCPLN